MSRTPEYCITTCCSNSARRSELSEDLVKNIPPSERDEASWDSQQNKLNPMGRHLEKNDSQHANANNDAESDAICPTSSAHLRLDKDGSSWTRECHPSSHIHISSIQAYSSPSKADMQKLLIGATVCVVVTFVFICVCLFTEREYTERTTNSWNVEIEMRDYSYEMPPFYSHSILWSRSRGSTVGGGACYRVCLESRFLARIPPRSTNLFIPPKLVNYRLTNYIFPLFFQHCRKVIRGGIYGFWFSMRAVNEIFHLLKFLYRKQLLIY